MTGEEEVGREPTPHPGMLKVMIQLMKLRVIVLLQVTAICAILVHDALARYDLILSERTWADTIIACIVTVVGGTLSAGGSNSINMWYDADIDPHDAANSKTARFLKGIHATWCLSFSEPHYCSTRLKYLLHPVVGKLPFGRSFSVLVLRPHLLHLAQAQNATKHRHRRDRRCNPSTHWLGSRSGRLHLASAQSSRFGFAQFHGCCSLRLSSCGHHLISGLWLCIAQVNMQRSTSRC